MPTYKVKAFDGKTLTVQADDESALDEAMQDYEASISKPAPESEGSIMANQLPFGPTFKTVARGENPYTATPEGASAAFGDVGAAAGLGAAGLALGAAPVAAGVGLGALAGYGLEKSGISPLLREKANDIRAGAPEVAPFSSPPSSLPDWLQPSMLKSMASQVPREAAATSVDLVPSVATMALSGLGVKGLGKVGAGASKLPTQASGAAGLLQAEGGSLTPAMLKVAGGGTRNGIPAAVENLAKANPLTAGIIEKNQAKNVGAINKYAAMELPQGEIPKATMGQKLGETFEAFQKRRGGEVGAAKNAARSIQGEPGKFASDSIIKQLEDGGVPSNETGFDTASMTGRERLSKPVAETLVKVERDLRGATLEEAINYLDNFDEVQGPALRETYKGSADRAISSARSAIKDSIVRSVKQTDPELASQLQKADRQYSVSQGVVKPALKAIRGEGSDAGLVQRLFGKSGAKGDKSLARLQRTMTPEEFSGIQDGLLNDIMQNSRGVDGLSLNKLKTNLAALGENARYLKPEQLQALKNVQAMMETANVADLAVPNPSGSGTRALQNLATTGGIAGAGAALSSPLPLAGYLGGSAAQAAYLKAPGAIYGMNKALRPAGAALSKAIGSKGATAGVVGAGVPATLREAMRQRQAVR